MKNHNESEFIWLLGLFVLWVIVISIAVITLQFMNEHYLQGTLLTLFTIGFIQYIFNKIKPNI